MMELLRSLPQGLLWYPLLLVLAVALARALWLVRLRSPRGAAPPRMPDHFDALAHEVARARVEPTSRRDLERRLIGLLLQAHGYSGYTTDNCRAFVHAEADSPAAQAVMTHLAETQAASEPLPPGRSASGRGVSGPVAGGEPTGDPLYRIGCILDAIEALEAKRGTA